MIIDWTRDDAYSALGHLSAYATFVGVAPEIIVEVPILKVVRLESSLITAIAVESSLAMDVDLESSLTTSIALESKLDLSD